LTECHGGNYLYREINPRLNRRPVFTIGPGENYKKVYLPVNEEPHSLTQRIEQIFWETSEPDALSVSSIKNAGDSWEVEFYNATVSNKDINVTVYTLQSSATGFICVDTTLVKKDL